MTGIDDALRNERFGTGGVLRELTTPTACITPSEPTWERLKVLSEATKPVKRPDLKARSEQPCPGCGKVRQVQSGRPNNPCRQCQAKAMTDDSEDELTGGEWVTQGPIKVWQVSA